MVSLIHPMSVVYTSTLGRVYCIISANVQVLLILKDHSNLYSILQ
jgi:hypothetical protein